MQTPSPSALLHQRLTTPRESREELRAREARSLTVARQMLSNGCSANAVTRYTGLPEAKLRSLYAGV